MSKLVVLEQLEIGFSVWPICSHILHYYSLFCRKKEHQQIINSQFSISIVFHVNGFFPRLKAVPYTMGQPVIILISRLNSASEDRSLLDHFLLLFHYRPCVQTYFLSCDLNKHLFLWHGIHQQLLVIKRQFCCGSYYFDF